MRKFVIGLTASLLVFFLLWTAFFHFAPRQIFGFDYAMWEAKHDLIDLQTEPVDVLIIGDSGTVSSLKATGTTHKTLNLALPCGGMVEGSFLLAKYLEKHPAPKVVVLSPSVSLTYNLDCFRDFFLPYGLASLSERADVVDRFSQKGSSLSLFGKDEEVLDAVALPVRARHSLYVGLTALHLSPQQMAGAASFLDFDRWSGYSTDYAQAIANRGHYAYGTLPQFDAFCSDNHGMRFDDFKPNPVMTDAIDQMTTLAKSKGAKVLLRFMALNEATTEKFTENFWRDFDAYLDEYSKRHPDVAVERRWNVWPDDAFGDAFCHTNAKGAELETAALEKKLDEVIE